jgi:hypothetical protein
LISKKFEKEIVYESSVLAWIRIRIEQKNAGSGSVKNQSGSTTLLETKANLQLNLIELESWQRHKKICCRNFLNNNKKLTSAKTHEASAICKQV